MHSADSTGPPASRTSDEDAVVENVDFSVGRIGWVEGIMAKPDGEPMSQLVSTCHRWPPT
jgi:hypothetical protein